MRASQLVAVGMSCVLLVAATVEADYIAVDGPNDDYFENTYCSLREAIQAAVEEDSMWSVSHGCIPGDGDDVISLQPGRYTLTRGQLDITGDIHDLKIEPLSSSTTADEVILDGLDAHRIAYIHFQTGDVTFERITFTNGRQSDAGPDRFGGALRLYGVEVFLDSCVVESNLAERGGGIYLNETVLTIDDSSFTDNNADSPAAGTFLGGAIYAVRSVIYANNSTFSYNNAAESGGAIYLDPDTSSAWLRHVTITDNNCGFGDYLIGDGGGVFLSLGANLNFAHTIIAGNHDLTNGDTKDRDCAGAYGNPVSYDHNIVGDSTACGITAQADDHFGTTNNLVDPGLAPLTTNARGTKNHLPFPSGPAEAGGAAQTGIFFQSCDGSGDQRGVSRPKCGGGPGICICDIGAVELQSTDPIFVDGFESGNTFAWQ